jgi:hypothetical protein
LRKWLFCRQNGWSGRSCPDRLSLLCSNPHFVPQPIWCVSPTRNALYH